MLYNFKFCEYNLLMATLARQHSESNFNKRCQEQNNRCVCQICTCGKHHCPPRHIAFKAETSNQHFYKPYGISVEKSKKCAYTLNQNHYDPELLKSTYRANYKPFHLAPTHYQSKYAYQPNNNKFYDETQYKKSYTPHQIEVQHSNHCDHQYYKNAARFDGTTTYGEQFRAKKGSQHEVKKHYAYQQNKLPFNGHTTYGDNFKKYQIVTERPQTCCEARYQKNGARFEAKSSYKQDFQGRQADRGCRCLIEELPPRPRECSPGKEHVTFSAKDCHWE